MGLTESKVQLVEPDASNRCQAVHKAGQCRYGAMEGSQYCAMHGGNKAQAAVVAKAKRQYQLAKWQATVDGFADDDEVKSLRGEIGITRMLMQETIGRCKNNGDLMMYSGKITDLVSKIEKLVVSCHRLETNLGQVLDKSKVLELAAMMVEIMGRYIKDDAIMSEISDEIVAMVLAAQGTNTKE